jgi:hypothetical protein
MDAQLGEASRVQARGIRGCPLAGHPTQKDRSRVVPLVSFVKEEA